MIFDSSTIPFVFLWLICSLAVIKVACIVDKLNPGYNAGYYQGSWIRLNQWPRDTICLYQIKTVYFDLVKDSLYHASGGAGKVGWEGGGGCTEGSEHPTRHIIYSQILPLGACPTLALCATLEITLPPLFCCLSYSSCA